MTALDERSKHLRRLIVRGLIGGNCGHIGASMSLVEILRVLYDDVMKYDPKLQVEVSTILASLPDGVDISLREALVPRLGEDRFNEWMDRDRCILSKGHGCLALYAILADKGFFPVEELDNFCRKGALLGGHPDAKVSGVEAATGSLGHGLSIGVGMALAARIQKRKSRVFVIVGDGEIQEGSIWEAAMCAAKHKLDNLTVIVDCNRLQSAGSTSVICGLEPLRSKWGAFGFAAVEIDGHNVGDLRHLLRSQSVSQFPQPFAIIANTVKGKGIPFAENDPLWHHRPHFDEATITALKEAVAA